MRHTIFLSLVLVLIGCSSKGVVGPVPLDQEFSLHINQTASVKSGLTIRLDSVPEDSRCPEGATCVWAGTAVVALTVIPETGSPSQVRLYTNVSSPTSRKDTLIAGYRITLVDVKPYPSMSKPIEPGEYEAVLKVSQEH